MKHRYEISHRLGGDSELGREKRHLGGYGGGHGHRSSISGPFDRLKSMASWIIKPLDEHGPDPQVIEQAGETGIRAAGLAGNLSWRTTDRDRALASIAAQIKRVLPGENAPEMATRWLSEYIRREGITFDR